MELTSPLRGTKVYLDDKYIGEVPLQLSKSKLKQLGLTYPYKIDRGNQQWVAWDIDVDNGNAITVQNDPRSKIAGRFRFQVNPGNSDYKSLEEGSAGWMVFELGLETISDDSDRELGQRLTAIPISSEGDAAAAGR